MALESATYISELVDTNPAVSDPVGQGDDHLKMIKTVLKTQFSGLAGTTAITTDESEMNLLDGGYEGTAVVSTGESGGTKFLREDGDATCSWQVPPDTDTTYTAGDGLDLTGTTFSTDLKANGGLDIDSTELSVAQGISQYDVAQFATGVVDDDFLRIDGTAVEGRSASEVLSDIGASPTAGNGSLVTVGTVTSGTWNGTAVAAAYVGSGVGKLATDASWSGSQRGTPSTVTDGTLDLDTANNFLYTPAGADVLEFSNETTGQSGFIKLINPSGYTISLGSEVKAVSTFATDVTVAGTYLITYFSDPTNVYVSASAILV
jgi:hypothetical protein